MTNPAEQFIASNNANIDTLSRFANLVLEGAERLVRLQMDTARNMLEDNTDAAKALVSVKDPQEYNVLRARIAESAVAKALDYSRNLQEAAAQTQAEITKLMDERINEINKGVHSGLDKASKNAPMGSDFAVAAMKSSIAAATSAMDTMTKAARQVAELSETTIKSATANAENFVRKSGGK